MPAYLHYTYTFPHCGSHGYHAILPALYRSCRSAVRFGSRLHVYVCRLRVALRLVYGSAALFTTRFHTPLRLFTFCYRVWFGWLRSHAVVVYTFSPAFNTRFTLRLLVRSAPRLRCGWVHARLRYHTTAARTVTQHHIAIFPVALLPAFTCTLPRFTRTRTPDVAALQFSSCITIHHGSLVTVVIGLRRCATHTPRTARGSVRFWLFSSHTRTPATFTVHWILYTVLRSVYGYAAVTHITLPF